jgi:hypothetical protein
LDAKKERRICGTLFLQSLQLNDIKNRFLLGLEIIQSNNTLFQVALAVESDIAH